MNDLTQKQRAWIAQKLEEKGWGARTALARHLDVRPDAITRMTNLEAGKEVREITAAEMTAIAEFFGEDPPGISVISERPMVIRPAGPEPSEVEKVSEGWPDVGDEWMDVRGVAVGGADAAFYFEDVVDRVRRPPGIRNAKNVAALNALGESMVPRFRNGELIYVQLREPVPGDDVVIELYPENDGDAPKAFLKELVRTTGRRLYCKQHNPKREIEFDRGEVHRLWRVLTLRDLLG